MGSVSAPHGIVGAKSSADAGSHGFLPDRTFLLRLENRAAAERARARDTEGSDRIGGREQAFHDRIGFAFGVIAGQEPERIRPIDAAGAPEAVTARLLAGRQLFLVSL